MDYREFINLIENNRSAAKLVIEAEQAILTIKNSIGETPLHYLVVENRLESVMFLKELGADINTVDYFMSTPLMHAVRLGYSEMVDYLLSCGADLNAKTVNGDTALSYAVMKNDEMMTYRLLALGKKHIQNYFNDLDAADIVSASDTKVRKHIVDLGLVNPYDSHE